MNPIKAGLGLCRNAFGALALLVPFMAFGLTSCNQNDGIEDEEVEEVEVIEDNELQETE